MVGVLVAETIHPACICEGGGRGGEGEADAPSDLKMPFENGRADEKVSKGWVGERASSMCVSGSICREGGTPSSSAGRCRVPSRRPPPTAPHHNGLTCVCQRGIGHGDSSQDSDSEVESGRVTQALTS